MSRSSDTKAAAQRLLRDHAAPLAIALSIALIYYVIDLRGGDLAAHLYRAELWKRNGFFVWNYNWYGGHYVVSYGVLFPALSGTIGVRLAGALAYITGTLLFSMLARRAWPGTGGRMAAIVFAVSFSATLVIGQLPFALGVAFGLAAMLAASSDRAFIAGFLAFNCALTSPLAALFVAFVAFIVWVELRTRPYLAVAVFAMAPAMLVSLLFPEGGSQPFHILSYLVSLLVCAVFWFAVRDEIEGPMQRVISSGLVLYLVFLTLNEIIPSPVGGNAIRLGMLLFAPIAAAILWPRVGRYAFLFVIPLFAWQAAPAVWAVAIHDRTGDPSYFKPLNAWLDKQDPAKQAMVEVVFTRNHFETAYVADRRPIARGWERQLDIKYNPLFYEDELTSARYARWLTTNDVRWVAVPRNAKIDYSGRNEADLIAARPPYLELKTTLRDWRLYEVHVPRRRSNDTVSFATAKHPLTIKPTHFGTTVTDLRWQRFQRPSRGCIEPTDNGQLELYLAAPIGPGYADTRPPAVTITTDYSLRRLVGRGASCAVGYKSKTDERAGEA